MNSQPENMGDICKAVQEDIIANSFMRNAAGDCIACNRRIGFHEHRGILDCFAKMYCCKNLNCSLLCSRRKIAIRTNLPILYPIYLLVLVPTLTAAVPPAAGATVEGAIVSIPAIFNFDVAARDVGTYMDCGDLSDAMCYGKFPKSLLIREEMKTVWSTVLKGLIEENSQWVIVGSPGMGKSVLTVLLSFHIAKTHGIPVFLARQLRGEDGPQGGQVVLCIRPGGEAVCYPKRRVDRCDMKTISTEFGHQFVDSKIITILDGWTQTELDNTAMGADFGGFDVLATSAQYSRSRQNTRRLIMMPAWKEEDLVSLGAHHGLDEPACDDRLFHAGGSAREFLRSNVQEIRDRIDETIVNITAENCEGLLAGYGASPGTGRFDNLRNCYLCNSEEGSYTRPSCWVFAVDSTYALRLLREKAPIAVFKRALLIAQSSGKAHYGWAFETLVHQLFFLKQQAITLHVQADDADEYESFSLGSDSPVYECFGRNLLDAKKYLGSRTIDTAHSSYWHPEYPSFPIIDSIACVPTQTTVWYINLTVGREKNVDLPGLTAIDALMKTSLARSLGFDMADWKFKYVAIEPSLKDADLLILKVNGAERKRKVDEGAGKVVISKGYLGKY